MATAITENVHRGSGLGARFRSLRGSATPSTEVETRDDRSHVDPGFAGPCLRRTACLAQQRQAHCVYIKPRRLTSVTYENRRRTPPGYQRCRTLVLLLLCAPCTDSVQASVHAGISEASLLQKPRAVLGLALHSRYVQQACPHRRPLPVAQVSPRHPTARPSPSPSHLPPRHGVPRRRGAALALPDAFWQPLLDQGSRPDGRPGGPGRPGTFKARMSARLPPRLEWAVREGLAPRWAGTGFAQPRRKGEAQRGLGPGVGE